MTHNFLGYLQGCRCNICKASNAAHNTSRGVTRARRKHHQKSRYNTWALEVVRTRDLSRVMGTWINTYEERPGASKYRTMSGQGIIVMRSGVNPRQIRSIMNIKYRFTALATADKILVAIGKSDLLTNGQLQVVPNPRFDMETWIRLMKEKGCEFD